MLGKRLQIVGFEVFFFALCSNPELAHFPSMPLVPERYQNEDLTVCRRMIFNGTGCHLLKLARLKFWYVPEFAGTQQTF